MALAWTQDRLGPMCRYAEDCAIVMSAIARPDGHDLSVSEIPFNWNANLDVRKLRIGYLKEGFEETRDAASKANDEKTLAQLGSLGVKLIEVKVPDWTLDVSAYAVESAAFFDELIRTGADKKMANPGRAAGWKTARAIPAVEFVQLQRARMMLMMKLAEATAGVDVYVVPGMGSPASGWRTGRSGARFRRRRSASRRSPTSGISRWRTLPATRAEHSQRLFLERVANLDHVHGASLRRGRTARARQGVPGRGRLPPTAAGFRRDRLRQRRRLHLPLQFRHRRLDFLQLRRDRRRHDFRVAGRDQQVVLDAHADALVLLEGGPRPR
jgi:hypothetical protein